MPIWRVAPSGISDATLRPIRRATSDTSRAIASSSTGSSTSTTWLSLDTCTNESPRVLGICWLTRAMVVRALSTAALVASTPTPKEQKPCSSGGEMWISATSIGMKPLEIRPGISWRWIGTKSARPALTASRTLAPMNSARWRKWPSMPGAT